MNYPEKFYNNTYVPTIEEFITHFMALNRSGNPKSAYFSFTYNLKEKKDVKVVEGDVLYSFGYVLDKYKKYILYTNSKNADKDEKYISKADKLQAPDAWFASSGDTRFYDVARTSRDNYLLSSYSTETLRKKLKIFLKSINLDKSIDESKFQQPEKEVKEERIESLFIDDDDEPF